tara:strand:- start:298 stop:648 length:351 start_codon:yes stop_codon:yes gene_type:complete
MTTSSKKRKIIKDKKFMQWVVNNCPCYVCNLEGNLNFHQIQFHHLQGMHRIGAMIRDDSTGIPICYGHHQELTFKFGERKFWEQIGIDPIHYANELYNEYQQEHTNDTKKTDTTTS